MSHILCHHCKQPIRDRDELVTASRRFILKPFHFKCFQEIEEETKTQWGLWIPVNGMSGNITFVLMLILAIVMLFTSLLHGLGDLIGLIALYPVVLRILSLVLFERRLPKLIKNKKPL